jgi:hypothetical protein
MKTIKRTLLLNPSTEFLGCVAGVLVSSGAARKLLPASFLSAFSAYF